MKKRQRHLVLLHSLKSSVCMVDLGLPRSCESQDHGCRSCDFPLVDAAVLRQETLGPRLDMDIMGRAPQGSAPSGPPGSRTEVTMVFSSEPVLPQQQLQCLHGHCCEWQHQRHWGYFSPAEQHSCCIFQGLFYTGVFSQPCQDGAMSLLWQLRVSCPTAWGCTGTARTSSSHLAHAQRRLLCRDDRGPDEHCEPTLALPEPLLRERVWVSQARGQRKKRDLILFRDTLVVAKTKRGSTSRPLLCLALGLLHVLSSGKGPAGDVAEEEEKGKASSSLVFLWPCGSCVITFCSRVVKELWVSALLGPPAGVQGARVSQLPSIRMVLKELSGRHAGTTLDAGSLEKLLQRQAQAGARQLPIPVVSSSEGGHGHGHGRTPRRRRRRLPWPLAWPRTLAAGGAPGPSGPAGVGPLFGRPLADLCSQDGMLPQPIQDLLALLNEHGPSTEGIFRLAVSQRACREVREALDSGLPVQLENQPVLLLAVLLKDFLRNIPSKLLDTQLFEEWMSAMEKTSRQERLAALGQVASKIPEANRLLLWRLLSLLSSISRNVATTKMTAGNLAICLAPNLLSPPEDLPLDILALETGKVTKLVEFLIDHHEELLGEQVARLAREGDEETPAPKAELETAEVPPVAPKSKQQRSFSGEKRFPGSSWNTRKRRAAWEEGSDGPPCLKKSRTELPGMGNFRNSSRGRTRQSGAHLLL